MTDSPQKTTSHSPGFWKEAWQRYRRRRLSMFALYFIALLSLVAIFSPMIAGTKPIICKYKGKIYFPCMGYDFATCETSHWDYHPKSET